MIIRKTLREQVVEILRHKILSGEIKPGERIIEAKVAEELKVDDLLRDAGNIPDPVYA